MTQAKGAIRKSSWAPVIDFDGIDGADVLLSPLYSAVLNRLRTDPVAQEPDTTRFQQLRATGYRLKTIWQEKRAARQSSPPSPADVVCWTRDLTHTANLLPVAAALAEQQISCRLMACQPRTFQALHLRNSDALYSLGAWPTVVEKGRREGVSRAGQLARMGPCELPPFPGRVEVNLEKVVFDTMVRMLPLVSEAIANTYAALDVLRARVLVVGNDLTLEGRAGCLVSAARGVPSAVFMHGSITGDPLHTQHCADRVLVYGAGNRQELMHQGLSDERIIVCGAPHLDRLERQTGQIHPLLQARLGLRDTAPWILVVTSGPGHRISHRHHQQVIRNLAQLGKTFPDMPVVVKLHRKDHVEYYEQTLHGEIPPNLRIIANDARGFPADIFDWFQGCRIVLTGASTASIEAMLMNVPVITMDFCDEIQDVDFIDSGATAHVCTSEALEQAVRGILVGTPEIDAIRSRASTYLNSAFFALDGGSAERGAKALRVLMGERTSAVEANTSANHQ